MRIDDRRLLGQAISSIEIQGNKITRPDIILREMRLHTGALATRELLEADLLRVKSLSIFNHVEFYLTARQGQSVLIITVAEEWYIFPLPYGYLKDGDPGQVVYGFRYRQNNFRGRDETLIAELWDGADRGFQLVHRNPWIQGTPAISRTIEFSQITRSSRLEEFKDLQLEERHTTASLWVGKRWTLLLSSELGLRFRLIQASLPQQLATSGQLDRLFEVYYNTTWDARDLRTFPRRGFYLRGQYGQGWILDSGGIYQRLALEGRRFFKFGDLSTAFRLLWQPSWGDLPPYDRLVMSDTWPLRSARQSDEGTSLYLASTEIRFDLLPLRQFTWEGAPLFPQYFKNLDYGLSAEVFADAGDIYTLGEAISGSSLHWGYGVGLLFLLPYVDVLRMEVSWSPDSAIKDGVLSFRSEISF